MGRTIRAAICHAFGAPLEIGEGGVERRQNGVEERLRTGQVSEGRAHADARVGREGRGERVANGAGLEIVLRGPERRDPALVAGVAVVAH